MSVISFSNNPSQCWQAAGWAFRQVLDDVSLLYPNDVQLHETFSAAKDFDTLIVEDLPPNMVMQILDGIERVAEGTLAGTTTSGLVLQPYGDAATIAQYKEGLRDLLSVLREGASIARSNRGEHQNVQAPPHLPGAAVSD